MWTCIQEVLRIAARSLAIPTEDFSGCPLFIQANARIMPLVDHGCFLQNPFKFSIHHCYHLTLCGINKITHKIVLSSFVLILMLQSIMNRFVNTVSGTKSMKKLLF
jgi:hypothetical protein